MKYAAIIIDNRPGKVAETMLNHGKYLHESWTIAGVTNEQTTSASGYNAVLTRPSFWHKFVGFDRVLIFQHDSGLLRTGIEEFLQYDFIGAPIANIPGCMNGGLSLRNPEKMLEICQSLPYKGMSIHGNEDIYFCNYIRLFGGKLPTKEVAQKFSVETTYALGSLGYHAIDKYLTIDEIHNIMMQYAK